MSAVARFEQIDTFLTNRMAAIGVPALRISLGLVFLWFGFLKFFPGMSSAEKLAVDSIQALSFGFVPRDVSLWSIAGLETLIGLGLIFGFALRAVLFLLWSQMLGTLAPLVLFPSETFKIFPWVPTLEGQYIIKNLVLISAGIAIGATVRGGHWRPQEKQPASLPEND